jgi:tight adherence protein B
MDNSQVILLIALAAGIFAWGAAQLVIELLGDDRKKITRRLSTGGRGQVDTILSRHNQSIILQIKGLPPFLARSAFFQTLNRKLIHAYPEASLLRFLAICVILLVMGFMIATAVFDSILIGMLAGITGAYLPIVFVNNRRASRQRLLAGQLPDALDFLCRILKAGHSLTTGIQMMGDELPKPISGEFRRCYDQHSLGQSLEQALRDMSARVDNSDFAFFVTAVLIQRQTGGDLGEVLRNISTMIRARVKLQQHVKAITAEGRFTGYILFGFPSVMFVISWALNPEYAGVLLKTQLGNILLGAAVGLQLIGLFVIRQIVNVKP